jgi:hypothetical protein
MIYRYIRDDLADTWSMLTGEPLYLTEEPATD